uniref:Uncharacterized protein n=1 Tax=Glossina brevipalpis TaxID=37001 RepID=A0A1A9WW15_9MUSC
MEKTCMELANHQIIQEYHQEYHLIYFKRRLLRRSIIFENEMRFIILYACMLGMYCISNRDEGSRFLYTNLHFVINKWLWDWTEVSICSKKCKVIYTWDGVMVIPDVISQASGVKPLDFLYVNGIALSHSNFCGFVLLNIFRYDFLFNLLTASVKVVYDYFSFHVNNLYDFARHCLILQI